ncbi:hypothetical protein [Streptomyces sp. NPDC086989]|uniref:hypothetical protein n=1 Tax=Streptomyces sp. NPDC086989 TaxID=3365764 RepID=UPI00381D3264
MLYVQLAMFGEEPYGRGYGGGIGLLFSLVLMCVFGPVVAVILGCAHSLLFTTPVMLASNAVGVRTRISAPWWALPATGLLAAAYAVPISLFAATSYGTTFAWIAAFGVLPVGVAVGARMRQIPSAKVRQWSLGPIVIAVIAAFCFGMTAPVYQPPVLERADYIGEWVGDGVRLELGAQAAVTAAGLPIHDGFHVVGRCSGQGTWENAREQAAYGRRAGVVLAIPDCKDAPLRWEVAGTDERPELFVLMGDPDDGEVAVLRKQAE